MGKKVIVIDPGHGGSDPGAVGNGLVEKEITLRIAQNMEQYLSKYNAEVILTRKTDIYVSLSDRANIANKLKADYFISIHVNAGGGSGFETYIHISKNPYTVKLQRTVHNRIIDYLSTMGIPDRGMKFCTRQPCRHSY